MKIIVVSLFVSYIVHGHFGIRDKIKKLLKLGKYVDEGAYGFELPVKPIDCLPCLSFYVSILVSVGFMVAEQAFTADYIYPILATYVITETIDKYKRS